MEDNVLSEADDDDLSRVSRSDDGPPPPGVRRDSFALRCRRSVQLLQILNILELENLLAKTKLGFDTAGNEPRYLFGMIRAREF